MCASALTARVQTGQTEQDAIDPFLAKLPRDLIRGVRHAGRIRGTHDGVMIIRDTADHALFGEFAQPVDRIDRIDVALESGPVEGDRHMAGKDIRGRPRGGDGAILGCSEMERHVTASYQCGGADDCDPACRQLRSRDERLRIKPWAGRCGDHSPSRLRKILGSCHQNLSIAMSRFALCEHGRMMDGSPTMVSAPE
jgi:hypothetical protein